MKITVDDEARNVLIRVCDSALRANGINALNDVNKVLGCIAVKDENKEEKK